MDIILQILEETHIAGYQDRLILIDNNSIVFACPCSRGPNHRTPRRYGGLYWNTKYGRLAIGSYKYECINHRKYGNSLLVNGGGKCKSDVLNPNHDDFYLEEIFIHKGYSSEWRGSAGCPVVHPFFWKPFIWFFRLGQKGELQIIRHTGCICESYS